MDTSTSNPTHKHRLKCTKEDLQFYALNMLHDLAHDYMEEIPLEERSTRKGGPPKGNHLAMDFVLQNLQKH